MPSNSLPTSLDEANSANSIYEQISRRSEHLRGSSSEMGFEPAMNGKSAEKLGSIAKEMETLRAENQSGEPRLESATLRGRVGLWIKRQLYRFLWWHSYQIRTAVELMARWNGVLHQVVVQSENRLRQIEAGQLELQTATRQNLQETFQLADRHEVDRAHTEHLTARVSDLERSALQTTTDLAQKLDAEVLHTQQLTGRLSDLVQKIDSENALVQQLAARLSDLGVFTHQTRASLSIQDRRLGLFIEEARKRLPQPLAEEDLRGMVDDHTRHRFDALYAAFEDIFRGTRDDVKLRQSVYLPLLKEHGVGSIGMPLLDLGCGRGEWVELLREHGLEARGVDLNEEMVERCKALGLPAVQGDSLPYLRTLPDACLGAVTAFHMVEHMPFDVVLSLVDESLRVLRPGGLLILETPNPSNLQVGALTFHLDPTHLKPLPSGMLRFFVEGRGFCDVHVLELHPYPEVVRLPDDGRGIANRLNNWFYGPQDYAVIGRRP